MIEKSVYDVFYNMMKIGLEKNHHENRSYSNTMRSYIRDLNRISETLKYNPYTYPELVPGYRYVLDFDFKPIYKIENDKVWIVDFISYERWNQAYQSYTSKSKTNSTKS